MAKIARQRKTLREEVGTLESNKQKIWPEHVYAQSKSSFIGLIDWANGLKLEYDERKLEEPWVEGNVSCDFELVIKIPLDQKQELLNAFFVLVDSNGFHISLNSMHHFMEGKDVAKMENSETKEDVA